MQKREASGRRKLLLLNKLGAGETSLGVIDFGLFLPWGSASDGYRLGDSWLTVPGNYGRIWTLETV